MKNENGMDEAVISSDCRLSSPALKQILDCRHPRQRRKCAWYRRRAGSGFLFHNRKPRESRRHNGYGVPIIRKITTVWSFKDMMQSRLLRNRDCRDWNDGKCRKIWKLAEKPEKQKGKPRHKKIDMTKHILNICPKKYSSKLPLKIVSWHRKWLVREHSGKDIQKTSAAL